MRQSAVSLAKNVFEILSKLPRHGVGARLSRKTWGEDCFWTIKEVRMSPDGRHGKADGVLTWRGVEEDSSITKPVRGPLKPVWQQLPGAPSQPKPEWISLAAAALASEQAAAGAATEDAIESEPTENAAVAEPSN